MVFQRKTTFHAANPGERHRASMLVLCPFPVGMAAGQRLKYEQYLDDWRAAGWHVDVSPFMDMDLWACVYRRGHFVRKVLGVIRGMARRWQDYLAIARYDLVYVHMNVTPIGTSLPERLTRGLATTLVYDIEDDVLGGGGTATSVNPIARLLRSSDKFSYLVKTADAVVTASPFMVDKYRALNRHRSCAMIPPSVDTNRFRPAIRNNLKPVIGWTGTFSSRPYLDLLRPVLQELARRVDFTLRVIGNFEFSIAGVDLDVILWSAAREVEDMQAIDIGLYPLPDDSWVLGKAGLKVIQYMAFGIPSVSTDVGTASDQVRHGETGFLVKTDDEWLATLQRLVGDAALRARIGTAARAEAVRLYSHEAVGRMYREVLDRTHPVAAMRGEVSSS